MESLDDGQSVSFAQRAAVQGRLVAVQLYAVQSETVGIRQYGFFAFVDEDAYGAGLLGQVAGHLVDEARRTGIEHQSDVVHTQGFDLADVVAVGHAAYFDKKVHKAEEVWR